MSINEILQINDQRLKDLDSVYDPIRGLGSPTERFKLYLEAGKYIFLPKRMTEDKLIASLCKYKSVKKYCSSKKKDIYDVIDQIVTTRMIYDFEYWCATCVKIQDKQSKKLKPFIMRRAQLKLFNVLISEFNANRPIRAIVLKARQWGGSTLIQIFMAWIQVFHRRAWHSVIVADIEDQSRNIKSMYSRLAVNHPKEICDITFKSFEGSSKNKIIPSRDCVVYLGSMQKPDSLRSADVMMAHLSEVGLWHSTDGKKPEDVIQSIAGTVPLEPLSLIVIESTAKGVGNFFHKQWCKSVDNENGYIPIFVAWYEIDIYSKPFDSQEKRIEFAHSLTTTEKEYFRLGATLEAINWYREKKHTDSYDNWRMCCEFPTTPQEAFQSTGQRAHAPEYISQMRRYTKKPLYKGDMFADASFGAKAINHSLYFRETVAGNMWVWTLPDTSVKISNRYIVSMDIGGRNSRADYSVISVIDRYWMIEGGVEEAIATCRFHLDQDLAVWKAVQIAKFYNNALLVVEANSLNIKNSEGDHSITILDEIKGAYNNIYCRSDPQKIIEGYPERYGFFTSVASKTDLVNQMNKRFREIGYIERDSRALDEADCYEQKENGSYGAVEGEHDDIYMSRAIGLKASQTTPLPSLTKSKDGVKNDTKNTILTEISF